MPRDISPLRSQIPGLPIGKRMTIFRGVETVLLQSTLLQCVKTVRSFRGESDRDGAPPSPDQCPWMRLDMPDEPIEREALSFNRIRVEISIELATAGSSKDDIVNLWEAVENSMASNAPAPGGTNVQIYLRQLIQDPATMQFTAGANDFQFSRVMFQRIGSPADGVIVMNRAWGLLTVYTFKPA